MDKKRLVKVVENFGMALVLIYLLVDISFLGEQVCNVLELSFVSIVILWLYGGRDLFLGKG